MVNSNGIDSVNPDNPNNGITNVVSGKNNDNAIQNNRERLNDLSIKINNQYASHSIIIFKLAGNLLQQTISNLRNSINTNKQQHTFLILDMKDVILVSSAGWGLFIAEQKKLKEERRTLFLTDFQPDLQQIFESLQLHLIIPCFPSVSDCLKSIYSEIQVDSVIKQTEHNQIVQNPENQKHTNQKPPQTGISNDPIDCILNAIEKYGPCSFFKLLSILQSKEYNKLKIGPLKLRSLLKEIGLDTFEKRLRYFRSC
jgi:anti-anti-sigma factor